jgi:mono/diheme cytochrome c family protein
MKHLLVAAVLIATASVASAAEGKAVFGSKCAACHGTDGKGQGAMGKKVGVKDLTVTTLTSEEMEAVITKGKGKMTPFGGKLTPVQIHDVAAFVKGGLK